MFRIHNIWMFITRYLSKGGKYVNNKSRCNISDNKIHWRMWKKHHHKLWNGSITKKLQMFLLILYIFWTSILVDFFSRCFISISSAINMLLTQKNPIFLRKKLEDEFTIYCTQLGVSIKIMTPMENW